MLAFASLLAVLPAVSLATPLLVERATDISGSPNGFKLPTPRGWADATDSASPCGGISYNATALSDFPMSGGDISILTKADGDRLQINVARTAEATKNSNFVSLLHEVQSVYRGHQCYKAPDFSALGFAVGDAVTLQLSYAAGVKDTILYQCADVTLVATDSFVAAEGAFCINGAYDVATSDANDYSDQLGGGGLSAAQKGGIGAGVSIAGLLLLGGLAAFFYRKKEAGKASSAAHGAHSIDGRTLHGDNSSFASRDMAQKVAA